MEPKLEGPALVLSFLGIQIDKNLGTLALPKELQEAGAALSNQSAAARQSCRKDGTEDPLTNDQSVVGSKAARPLGVLKECISVRSLLVAQHWNGMALCSSQAHLSFLLHSR